MIKAKWLWTVVDIDMALSLATDDKFTSITWVRVKSFSSTTGEEANKSGRLHVCWIGSKRSGVGQENSPGSSPSLRTKKKEQSVGWG
jgi:hypothetical protein